MSVERSVLSVERSPPGGAVFLSYASQDADAARRIAQALRAEGIEVWLDESALAGGEAWDASIRRQIRDCALFVAIGASLFWVLVPRMVAAAVMVWAYALATSVIRQRRQG